MIHDGNAISVAPPSLYASRFTDFMTRQVGAVTSAASGMCAYWSVFNAVKSVGWCRKGRVCAWVDEPFCFSSSAVMYDLATLNHWVLSRAVSQTLPPYNEARLRSCVAPCYATTWNY